jgi:DNA uptake protein ComE-like DNA-binding protein
MLSRHDQISNNPDATSVADYRGDPKAAMVPISQRMTAAGFALLLLLVSAIPLAREVPIDTADSSRTHLLEGLDSKLSRPLVGIDPNTATWAEIALLPGLGESVAQRWIDFRESRRTAGLIPPFNRPEDLMQINGIGEKVLRRIRPFLRFDAPANPTGKPGELN